MKQKKTFIIVALLLAVLLLGIGYAAMAGITLNINGTANATIDNTNFVVKFVADSAQVSNAEKVTATVTDDKTARIAVNGLTAKGDYETATYTIKNESADLSARLSAAITNNNKDYFKVEYTIADTEPLASGATTTITVKVSLLKTPIDTDQNATIGVAITADPLQPTV